LKRTHPKRLAGEKEVRPVGADHERGGTRQRGARRPTARAHSEQRVWTRAPPLSLLPTAPLHTQSCARISHTAPNARALEEIDHSALASNQCRRFVTAFPRPHARAPPPPPHSRARPTTTATTIMVDGTITVAREFLFERGHPIHARRAHTPAATRLSHPGSPRPAVPSPSPQPQQPHQ